MEKGYAIESAVKIESPKKKMNFIKRWFAKMSHEAWEEARNQPVPREDIISAKQRLGLQVGPPSIDQPERAIQFTVYVANGGRVIETKRWERKTDRNQSGLYIITNDQDFGKEIDKIITMEALK